MLTTAIHDFRTDQNWDVIDFIDVSFRGRPTGSEATEFNGIFGIASITLAYTFLNPIGVLENTSINTSML